MSYIEMQGNTNRSLQPCGRLLQTDTELARGQAGGVE